MTPERKARYIELNTKDKLTDKEFQEFEVLQKARESEPIIAQFRINQAAPYNEKISRAGNLAWEFYLKMEGQCYVAVGGLDSITLYLFLLKEGIRVPAISVSSLEDKSIQAVHKALGIQSLKPSKPKALTALSRKSTAKSKRTRAATFIPRARSGQTALCAALAFTSRSVRIGSTSSGHGILKNGTYGCTMLYSVMMAAGMDGTQF